MTPTRPAAEADAAPGPAGPARPERPGWLAGLPAPVRRAYAQALARRAQAHEGDVRRVLDAKLAGLSADSDSPGLPPAVAAPVQPGPLAHLVAQLNRDPGQTDAMADRPREAPGAGPVPGRELKALQQHRATWARLSLARQLQHSIAQLPPNPGPLNSQLLALRTLQWLDAHAPAYLQAFAAQIQTLSWLADASATQDAPPLPSRAASKTRSTSASRAAARVRTESTSVPSAAPWPARK